MLQSRPAVGTTVEVLPSRARARFIPRPELFAVLEAAERVVQVSAPAGSGKTFLLRSWIAAAGLEERAAWVHVAREERDPQRFWLDVLDSLRRTSAGAGLVRELTAAPDLDGAEIVQQLLEDLASLDRPLWLVIDDLHELQAKEAIDQLELLLRAAPAELRFVLLTRRDQRLGLHRLRLEGELTEIRAEDLRFSLEEARRLLEAAGVSLSDSGLEALVDITEGWAAGLRLAALSLARHPDPERFALSFSGRERAVAEYLLAEVLQRQPEEITRLLLRTSILDQVNGPLADRLTGSSGSGHLLAELEDAGAFVVAVNPERSWFRYHRLVGDLLALELLRTAPDELPRLHLIAAGWFAEHGYPVEAIRHAQAAESWDLAARLLSDNWFGIALDGRRATARELLSGFPAGMVAGNPELAALAAFEEQASGSLDAAERYLTLAQRRSASVPEDRRGRLLVALTTVRLSLASTRNDLDAVAEEAQRLFVPCEGEETLEPALGEDLRVWALADFGIAELWAGRLAEADQHLERALGEARRTGRPLLELQALVHWAVVGLRRSQTVGEQRARQAIELARRHGWGATPSAAVAYIVLGAATVWSARLGEAQEWLDRAESALAPDAHPAPALLLYVSRALLEAASGRYEEAMRAFRAAEQMERQLVAPHMLATSAHAHQLQMLVRLGELERVQQALDQMDEAERGKHEMRAVLAALRLAQDDPEAAAAALASIPACSMPIANPRWDIQALLLEASTRDALGDPGATSRALEGALELAEPEGLLLPFLLVPVPELLERHARLRTAHASLISEILTLLTDGPAVAHPENHNPLREPLSDSELRVLRYLPTNLQAAEIASELVVSVNTVRTHMRHLYAKLDVHRRADAVERARALGLLSPSARGH